VTKPVTASATGFVIPFRVNVKETTT